jgi:hypothetical protein
MRIAIGTIGWLVNEMSFIRNGSHLPTTQSQCACVDFDTPNDLLLLLFIKDLLVMGNQYFGGQVKFEILVAQGQPHHFWISETLVANDLQFGF